MTATNLADARKQGGVFAYGDFITIVINFLIVAVALFAVIKGINTLNRKPKDRPRRAAAAGPGSRSPDADPRRTRRPALKLTIRAA